MTGDSNAILPGNDDQRTSKTEDLKTADRYNEGKDRSHMPHDSKDERSIANKLGNESKKDKEGDGPSEMEQRIKDDPTYLAKSHGNEPSKGAKIDAEIQAEEEALLAKKDAKKH